MDLGLPAPRLRAHFAYPRFVNPEVRVLLLEPRYHVVAEARRALAARGHEVLAVPVPAARAVGGEWIRTVLVAASAFRPDFVLAVNHLGFDVKGSLAGVLDGLGLPTAVWYVDSPEFILLGAHANATPSASLFLWERALVPELRAAGFEDVSWLPLAADDTRFTPPAVPVERPLAFVGDSMVRPVREWRERVPAAMRRRCEGAAGVLAGGRDTPRARVLDLAGAAGAPGEVQATALAYVTLAATAAYRTGVLSALPRADLHLYGDDGWTTVLPGAPFHGAARYEDGAPRVYAGTAVNLNATSLQMPTAVNQRVFDVPAAGGFLLTDQQEDVRALFPGEGEVVTYASPEEARDKAAWYGSRPDCRERVVAAARARILACHTYRHRVDALIGAMRTRFGWDTAKPGAARAAG